jgi:hypothetical protein
MSDFPVSFPSKPSDVEFIFVHGIGKILISKYHPALGEDSNLIAVAILNHLFLKAPGNEKTEHYRSKNALLIEREARAISSDPELSYVVSVLYTFMLIGIGPTDPERSSALVERASELMIDLETPEELCPGCDFATFLSFVRNIALALIAS